jgi:hypothetical protein
MTGCGKGGKELGKRGAKRHCKVLHEKHPKYPQTMIKRILNLEYLED